MDVYVVEIEDSVSSRQRVHVVTNETAGTKLRYRLPGFSLYASGRRLGRGALAPLSRATPLALRGPDRYSLASRYGTSVSLCRPG